jgi:MoxR-like ATPase
MLTVRARALLDGRLAPSIADVAALARPVLTHRMALSFAARARGESLNGLIDAAVTRSLGLEAAA